MDTRRLFIIYSTFVHLYPVLVPFVDLFSSSLIKAHKLKLRLGFLRRCHDEHVMPRSFLPRRLIKLSDKPFDDYQRLILQKYIELTKIEVDEAFRSVRNTRYNFNQAVPVDWKDKLLDYCYGKLRRERSRLRNHLNRKIRILVDNSDWTKHANPNFVVNLSNKLLDKDTISALGYGMSFSVSTKKMDWINIAKSFCNLEKFGDLPIEDFNICKGVVYGALSECNFSNVPMRFLKCYQNLKKDDSLYITKADKSSCLVLLNKNDYIDKMCELLSDNTTYVELNSNPLELTN